MGHLAYLGVVEQVLELADSRLHQPLFVLGGVVVGVFAQVAVGARLLDFEYDVGPLEAL